MKKQTQQEKLKSIGFSMLALGFFPLFWFLSQAILFRELTEIISRNLLVVVALIIGSSFAIYACLVKELSTTKALLISSPLIPKPKQYRSRRLLTFQITLLTFLLQRLAIASLF